MAATLINSKAQQLISVAQELAPYLLYKVKTTYVWNEGRLQLPVAQTPGGSYLGTPSDRPSAKIVRAAAPHGIKIVRIAARRINAMPILPNPRVSMAEGNEPLLSAVVETHSPDINADMKTRVFTVLAEYRYLVIQPIWVAQDGAKYPLSGADGYSRTYYTFGPDQFASGMIEDS